MIDKLPVIREITNLFELNALGCRFFLTANHTNSTQLITRSLRWLTVQHGMHCMTNEQEAACKRINELIAESDKNIEKSLNIRILLDRDPRKPSKDEICDNTHIKKLIQIGADVRFVEHGNRMKMVLQENELFLSFSQEQSKMVSIGYHYVGKSKDDALCQYFLEEFNKQFEKAKKLAVRNEVIVLARKKVSETLASAFNLTAREWVIVGIGVLASIIASLL